MVAPIQCKNYGQLKVLYIFRLGTAINTVMAQSWRNGKADL
jgi:hypothetical protein